MRDLLDTTFCYSKEVDHRYIIIEVLLNAEINTHNNSISNPSGVMVTSSPEFELTTPGCTCMTFYECLISQSQSENFTNDWNNNLFFSHFILFNAVILYLPSLYHYRSIIECGNKHT
jgi:Icc-related predicted phosphoesterase